MCNSSYTKKSDLVFLEKLVNKFLIVFKKVFPGETITFKMHHLLHYSSLILQFGNLKLCSTLRYERVHQKISRSLEGSRNRKNLAKSIAKRFTFDPEASLNDDTLKNLKKNQIRTFDKIADIDNDRVREYLEELNVNSNLIKNWTKCSIKTKRYQKMDFIFTVSSIIIIAILYSP